MSDLQAALSQLTVPGPGEMTPGQRTKAVRECITAGDRLNLVIGRHLNAHLETFPEKDRRGTEAAFYVWACEATRKNYAYVRRMMAGATAADRVKKVATHLGDIDGMAKLNALKDDAQIAEVLNTVPKGATAAEVTDAIATLYPKPPKDPQGEAERIARNLARLVTAHEDLVRETFAGVEDLRSAFIAGASVAGKIGADAPKVIAEVLPLEAFEAEGGPISDADVIAA